ncbi:MAG: FG-GAP-like repeat-containing protein [Propionibacteriaceae bacterium]|jgi:endonuclease/exonuclease/phosphatase family metal-dependent hydrolase|nr:FG-GAP-like repeat-containing protein [Propionibacteriaceae bacterium]
MKNNLATKLALFTAAGLLASGLGAVPTAHALVDPDPADPCIPETQVTETWDVTAMHWNILGSHFSSDFASRKKAVSDKLKAAAQSGATIFGLTETTLSDTQYLVGQLPGHWSYYQRDANSLQAIVWNTDVWTRQGAGFLYTEKVTSTGALYGLRGMAWTSLQHRPSGKVLRVGEIHLSPRYKTGLASPAISTTHEWDMIARELASETNPVLLLGDINWHGVAKTGVDVYAHYDNGAPMTSNTIVRSVAAGSIASSLDPVIRSGSITGFDAISREYGYCPIQTGAGYKPASIVDHAVAKNDLAVIDYEQVSANGLSDHPAIKVKVGLFDKAARFFDADSDGDGTLDNVDYSTQADVNGDGRADLVGFGNTGVHVSLGKADGTFAASANWIASFGYNQGWRVDKHPRLVADLNRDGKADLIGFTDDGVRVAVSQPQDKSFVNPVTKQADSTYLYRGFGYADGWRINKNPRTLADVNGDGKLDIVGFANDGVWVALGVGDGTFKPATRWLANFGYNQGWRVDKYPRYVVDVNGDGRADIVGFGADGARVAVSDPARSTFANPVTKKNDSTYLLADFGYNQGWRTERHPRALADVNGDGKTDIVGFASGGVTVSLGVGDGTFASRTTWLANFGYNSGWKVENNPRIIADVNGDGKADIVGFADDGVKVALSNGKKFTVQTSGGVTLVSSEFGYARDGWLVGRNPRVLADVNGDGNLDIIGFANQTVRVALGSGSGTFAASKTASSNYCAQSASGWNHLKHLRAPIS